MKLRYMERNGKKAYVNHYTVTSQIFMKQDCCVLFERLKGLTTCMHAKRSIMQCQSSGCNAVWTSR
jgi:hypothetical protein